MAAAELYFFVLAIELLVARYARAKAFPKREDGIVVFPQLGGIDAGCPVTPPPDSGAQSADLPASGRRGRLQPEMLQGPVEQGLRTVILALPPRMP